MNTDTNNQQNTDSTERLLTGYKVLDFSTGVAGPYSTKLMASMGADVIKVESPNGGDESRREGPFPNDIPHQEKSALFLYLNTSKKSITLDLQTQTGQIILKKLVSQADVLVESFQPKLIPSLGLEYETLEQINSSLVMTSVTDFGQTGPYKDYAAKPLNHYAYGGLMYITGRPEKEPLQMGPRLPEYGAGQNAFVATLSALWHRELTGEGQHVDISVAEYSVSVLENAISMYSYTRHKIMRTGNRGYGRAAWGLYPCKDGYVGVIAGPAHRWPAMAELMEEPELNDERFSTPRGRQDNADELEALMEPWLMRNTKREIFEKAQGMGIAFAYVASPEDIYSWEHLRERGYFVSIDHPEAGRLDYPGPPFMPEGVPFHWVGAPLLGEHNQEIYCERLGYTREELVRLASAGAV